ncbi:hypothetical protein LEP1GSC084_1064 [Leptospira interrogans serovar Medanensis str. L0448]|uniref:Uncharacterized protein n=1 Tax=Leptospira interrogans serovar Zanoni str. LT2156 TaxID=1001601 RepID=M6HB14_LEPIR|nr:hypothetical protein LEP1GSC099_1437 [Leptospira interrogans str. UI 08452]EMJ56518.1 hypothetical protein LEP1GSC111_1257 [Leptospira interrogans str. UT126]EMM94290.1 hypothetical protein LEP1GSC158_0664 [Leptospira interrogans serovar Zanoni str. LT2156]EMN33195.1 hypothetical protein LEP1GSC084_1064 [Leptospira interrogans serovar Medanensis str. L0448]EMN38318.1 hypothetical protein LEP1GSC085_0031 [Leptospira interrogans str. L0996]
MVRLFCLNAIVIFLKRPERKSYYWTKLSEGPSSVIYSRSKKL